MGFQVESRRSPEGISCFANWRSPDGTSYYLLNKWNRQMGFQLKGDRQKGSRISLCGGRQMGPHISFE